MTNDRENTRIVDPSGTPCLPRITWRGRWGTIFSRTRIIILLVVGIIGVVATFLGNLEKIENYFRSKPAPLTVPRVVVKLSNSSKKGIGVASRGDFILWLPGLDAYHTMGKYEFLEKVKGKPPENGLIMVEPNATVTVFAQIKNQDYYGKILEQSDCDISLVVQKIDGGIKITENMPFSKEAIRKYYISVDLGAVDNK